MTKSIEQHKKLLDRISKYVLETSEDKMSKKLNPEKWSKKEILGHLIDSGINNLQRFTEIQFEIKPYKLKPYQQDELVKSNNYQIAKTSDLVELLIAINKRVIDIIKRQTDTTLNYKVITSSNEEFNLEYLIKDYLNHFEHHIKQIME